MKVLTRFCATFFLLVSNSLWAQDLVGFDADSFGDIVLKRNQFAGSDTYQKYEAQVGAYNNEPITNYSANSVFAKIGRSVGRLDILTDVGVFPCTAFIIGENLLMTNYHCVPGIIEDDRAKATRIDGVQFVAGYTQTGVEEGTRKYTVVPQPLEADKNLDYAILRSIGAPQVEFGQLKLSSRHPEERDPYWVIGHPMGEALRISREKCRANSPAQSKGRLLHTCDTLPGNSGSPLIDASSRTVVGLHNAGSEKNEVNFAIPMYEILQNSKLAVDSPQKTVVTGGESGSALCDTLYTEAKFHAQCFAYRAYAERCSDHAFIGFASFYLEEHCAEAVEPVAKVLLRTWCDRETLSEAEKAVCGDRDLSQLDGQHEALSTALEGKPGTTNEAIRFRRERDSCGPNAACIARAYTSSLGRLREIASAATAPQAAPAPMPQSTSMQFTRYNNTDFPGGDLLQSGIRGISLQSCVDRCAQISSCVGFTYVDAKRWCWPKNVVASPVSKSGMTSGIKVTAAPTSAQQARIPGFTRFSNRDLPGGDLTTSGYRNVSLDRCEEICVSNDSCVSYSYVTSKRWCWPKGSVGTLISKSGVVSGILK